MNGIRKRNAEIMSMRVKLMRLSSLVKSDEDKLAKKLIEEINDFINQYPEEKDKFESTLVKLNEVIETAKAERAKAAEVAKQRAELLEEFAKIDTNDLIQCEKMLKRILVFITLNPDETKHFEAIQKELIDTIKSMKKLQTRENREK